MLENSRDGVTSVSNMVIKQLTMMIIMALASLRGLSKNLKRMRKNPTIAIIRARRSAGIV